jgi:hypothetical protein
MWKGEMPICKYTRCRHRISGETRLWRILCMCGCVLRGVRLLSSFVHFVLIEEAGRRLCSNPGLANRGLFSC